MLEIKRIWIAVPTSLWQEPTSNKNRKSALEDLFYTLGNIQDYFPLLELLFFEEELIVSDQSHSKSLISSAWGDLK